MPNAIATRILIGTGASLAILATLGLWARYGEVIFSDIPVTALGGCFF